MARVALVEDIEALASGSASAQTGAAARIIAAKRIKTHVQAALTLEDQHINAITDITRQSTYRSGLQVIVECPLVSRGCGGYRRGTAECPELDKCESGVRVWCRSGACRLDCTGVGDTTGLEDLERGARGSRDNGDERRDDEDSEVHCQ